MVSANLELAKKMNIGAVIVSIVVLALIVLMRGENKPDWGIDFSFLPPLYSSLNALTAFVLAYALYAIKQKNIIAHRRAIYVAFTFSVLFLLCYVLYHFTTPETKYCGEGTLLRTSYFILLISHIILAGVILPFILFTFIRAYTGQIEKHRKMAKWVFPLWFYVAATGPIIYLMLRPCYGG